MLPAGSVSLGQKVSTVLLGCSTLFLALVLAAVLIGTQHAEHTLRRYKPHADVFRTGHADPEFTQSLFSESVGGLSGSLPVFLQNSIFSNDFGSLGRAFQELSQSVIVAMAKVDNKNTGCVNKPVTIRCPSYIYGSQYYACPHGGYVYCDRYRANQVQTCPTWNKHRCPSGQISSVASMVNSIAAKVALMRPVTNDVASGESAFSQNVLRMDTMLSWLKVQSGVSGWKNVGEGCRELLSKVRGLDWDEVKYFSAGEMTRKVWNATSHLDDVFQYVDDVCAGFATMAAEVPPVTPAPAPTPTPAPQSPSTPSPPGPAPTPAPNGPTPSSPATQPPATPTPMTPVPAPPATPAPTSLPVFVIRFDSANPYNQAKFTAGISALVGASSSEWEFVKLDAKEAQFRFKGTNGATLTQKMEVKVDSEETQVAQNLGADTASYTGGAPISPPAPAPSSGGDDSAISVGVIVGIVIGVLAALVVGFVAARATAPKAPVPSSPGLDESMEAVNSVSLMSKEDTVL